MVKALISAPAFELATKEWYPWLVYYLAPQLKARGVEPVLVQGDKAIRENIWKLLEDEDIKAIFGCGHGNDNVFTGQNYDEIFVSCQYPGHLIENRCFAPVSCLVGRGLLPDMVNKGLGCGLGEITVYTFYLQPGVDPLQDWILALFTKAEFVYAISLAEGKTSGEAHALMVKAYYENADKVRDIDPEIAYTLEYDADNRHHFGDPNWKLVEGPPPAPGKYVCPWCEWSTDEPSLMREHIWNFHIWPELQPCFLPRFIRKILGCPIKR